MNKWENINKQEGQTFLEFLLLLFVVISMAFIIVQGVGAGVGTKWKAMIEKISAPTDTDIEFR
jgi:hypothetical protein